MAGTRECRSVCSVPLEGMNIVLAVTPAEGWRFSRWGGDCLGTADCAVRGGERVEAIFEPLPVITVRVEGPGVVESSDGRTCADECRWSTTAPLTLLPRAFAGSAFLGFVGACEALAPCQLTEGAVTAQFGTPETIRVEFIGDGGGQVSAGTQVCTSSCSLSPPRGTSLSLVATPDDTSLPALLGGACAESPCAVFAPAVVTVDFEAGRRIEVTMTGRAPGQVKLNGTPFCDAGTCVSVLSSTAPLDFTGTRADDYVSFRGFDGGGCQGTTQCFIPAASTPLQLEARFDSVIVTTRVFDARGQALYADDAGIALALVAEQAISIDGVSYSVGPVAAPTFAVLLETQWDAGIGWVVPLNQHGLADSDPRPFFESIARADDGDLYFGGNCYQGTLNGQAQCNGAPTPLTARVSGGALAALTTDPTFGTGTLNFDTDATIIDLTSFAGRMVAFRGVGAFGGQVSGGLGFLDQDAGFTPAFSLTRVPHAGIPTPHRCVESGATLMCVFNHRAALVLDDCSLPAASTTYDEPLFLEFDSALHCQRGLRVYGPSSYIGGVSEADADGGVLVFGVSGASDFGNGVTTPSVGTYVAEWVGGRVTRVGHFAHGSGGGGGLPVQVERGAGTVAVQLRVTGASQVYGRDYAVPTISLTFLDPSDLRSPLRRWDFSDGIQAPQEIISSTRFVRVGDKLVILVTGVNVRLGPLVLSSDNRRHAHLVVLQE